MCTLVLKENCILIRGKNLCFPSPKPVTLFIDMVMMGILTLKTQLDRLFTYLLKNT